MPNPNQQLAAFFRHQREKKRLSIEEVASRAGRKPHDIKRWESGRGPRFGSAVQWAEALGFEFKIEKIGDGLNG
jgi:transcriptional regulator with XRE-family HTH domain